MRVVIDVEQAPGYSFTHFQEISFLDFVEGLCPDQEPTISVSIEPGPNDSNEGAKWAGEPPHVRSV